MSFFDLKECLTVDGFLGWDYMIEEGWLVFNFDILQDNQKPKAEVFFFLRFGRFALGTVLTIA